MSVIVSTMGFAQDDLGVIINRIAYLENMQKQKPNNHWERKHMALTTLRGEYIIPILVDSSSSVGFKEYGVSVLWDNRTKEPTQFKCYIKIGKIYTEFTCSPGRKAKIHSYSLIRISGFDPININDFLCQYGEISIRRNTIPNVLYVKNENEVPIEILEDLIKISFSSAQNTGQIIF